MVQLRSKRSIEAVASDSQDDDTRVKRSTHELAIKAVEPELSSSFAVVYPSTADTGTPRTPPSLQNESSLPNDLASLLLGSRQPRSPQIAESPQPPGPYQSLPLSSDNEPLAQPASRRRPSIPDHTTTASPRALYPCQIGGIAECLKALKRRVTRIGISAPTGSGKTTTIISLLPEIPLCGRGHQVLILVPTITIAKQVAKQIRKVYGNRYIVEKEYDGEHDNQSPDALPDIIVATYQSLSGQSAPNLEKYKPETFKCIIVDEAHRSAAESYLRILHHFNDEVLLSKKLSALPGHRHGNKVPIIGFSATFTRTDRRALGWIYEDVVSHTEVQELLQQLLLAEVDIRSVREGTVSAWNALISNRHLAKLAEIAEAAREDLGPEVAVLDETPIIDPPRREMSNAVFAKTPEFVSHVVDTFRQHAASRRSTLIFCINRAMVQAITKAFVEQGIKTKAVDGHTRPHKRSTITADFNAGKFPVLVNCQVFTEGADIPSIDTIILASPTKSFIRLIQMIGRGRRISPDTSKTDCLIVDMFGLLGKGGLSVEPDLWQNGCRDVPPDNVMVTHEREGSRESSAATDL